MSWVIKYAPKNLKEFVNQKEAVQKFLTWYKNFKLGKKALLLYGPPGTGKTALVRAFATQENLDLIEMNASDIRNAERIREVFGHSMTVKSLFKRSKLFLIDEIDGISGREDRGGVGEIIKIIKKSAFPIVLTANDAWDPKLRSLRNYCELVQFRNLSLTHITKRLSYICQKEGIEADTQVLKQIASRAKGDLRAAINDLETVARGKKKITLKDLEVLGYREKEQDIFEILKIIFKSKSPLAAKLAIMNADRDPDEIFWWIEENIANEYEKIEEIVKAYDALSKADLFRRWISLRQNWRFLAYMTELMGGGVAIAKKEMYRKFTKYQSPRRLRILGRTKTERKEMKEILLKLSENLHCSIKVIRKEFLPFLRIMLKKRELRKKFAETYNLSIKNVESLIST